MRFDLALHKSIVTKPKRLFQYHTMAPGENIINEK